MSTILTFAATVSPIVVFFLVLFTALFFSIRVNEDTDDHFRVVNRRLPILTGTARCLPIIALYLGSMVLADYDTDREIFVHSLAYLSFLLLAAIPLVLAPVAQIIEVDYEGIVIKWFLKKTVKLRYEEIDYAEIRGGGNFAQLFIYVFLQYKAVLIRGSAQLLNLDKLAERFEEKNIRFYDIDDGGDL